MVCWESSEATSDVREVDFPDDANVLSESSGRAASPFFPKAVSALDAAARSDSL